MTLYKRQGSRPSPRKRNGKRQKKEALQIAEKRKDMKGKAEKERYTHLNAEFQRIAKRDKKAFFNEECKETEKNRIGKTRYLQDNCRHQRSISCKDGHDKGQKQ